MNSVDWKAYWDQKQADRKAVTDSGRVIITSHQSRIHVLAPFDPRFVTEAKELGGRWKNGLRVWSFPGRARRLVYALVERVYGLTSNVKEKKDAESREEEKA